MKEHMGKEKATATVSGGKTPAFYHVRARQRTSKVLGLASPACPSTPPLRSRITVPFLWEEAPGKPKLGEPAAGALLFPSSPDAAGPLPDDGGGATATAGGDREGVAVARPAPLKLPPRLHVTSRPEHSFSSPKTVLQRPYVGGGGGGCGEKPPRPMRRSESTVSCRMRLGTGGGAFSWRKATAGGKKDVHDHDTSCYSPPASSSASSSSSTSSSSSMSHFFDIHSRGSGHWQQSAVREDPEDADVVEDDAKGSVRITRFRRNRSLPNISTSHLWASIRKGVKQISPWRSNFA